ncbi:MAG TPA: hypothetical protein VH643_10315 [Gemmataceae bacterium]|jgi:WD40 repeat protein
MDRFGDPLPAGARARLGTTRLGHGNGIDRIAVSPDGKLLVTAGRMEDAPLRVWDLESDRFEVREKAQKELEHLGPLAGPALRRTLANRPLLETRRRVEALRTKLGQRTLSAEELQQVRAVELLERIGGSEARRQLKSLAGGASEVWLTREAKASLRRLDGQAKPSPERK